MIALKFVYYEQTMTRESYLNHEILPPNKSISADTIEAEGGGFSFPINLNLKGRLVLVIGGGRVGRRKLGKVLMAGGRVRLVEPLPSTEIKSWAEAGKLELFSTYTPDLLIGVDLVLVASNQSETNRLVVAQAQANGQWVNVADAPEESDFTLPAVVEQGNFRLTISTGGGSPALSAKVAEILRRDFGPEYGLLTQLLATLRPIILSSSLDISEREAIFRGLVENKDLLGFLAKKDAASVTKVLSVVLAPLGLKEPCADFLRLLRVTKPLNK